MFSFRWLQVLSFRAKDQPKHVEVPAVAARPEDISSIDGIMKAFYEVLSGPKGQPRQWSRDRTLYISDVRFVAMAEDEHRKPVAQIASHQQFVDYADPELVGKGFFEKDS